MAEHGKSRMKSHKIFDISIINAIIFVKYVTSWHPYGCSSYRRLNRWEYLSFPVCIHAVNIRLRSR
jgi:hypothetical protein